MGKTDSTGSYSYVCDGASPGSPVLSDGHATYTPGLSENRGGASRYYSNDRLGNLWTVDGSSKSQLTYEDNAAFGGLIAGASGGTPFGFGGGNGCQTDVDLGLVLMGHRYYDPRIGRFISQDPAGSGDNWYAYADNDPVDEVDPDGLMPMDGLGSSPIGSPGYNNIGETAGELVTNEFENFTKYTITHKWMQDEKLGADGLYHYVDRPGSDTWSFAQSSVTNPQGAAELGQLGEETTGTIKPGNPFGAADKALKAFQKSLSQAKDKAEIAKGDEIRDIKRIIDQWGGKIKNWQKMKGWMPSNNGEFDAEIHWYENIKDGIGRVEPKSKLW